MARWASSLWTKLTKANPHESIVSFFVYDYLVRRQEQLLTQAAVKNISIVNSLFPEKVRKQLYQEQKAEQEQAKNATEFLNPATSSSALASEDIGRPIAHLHDDTTIFFADLVGFTKWSSSRSQLSMSMSYGEYSGAAETNIG